MLSADKFAVLTAQGLRWAGAAVYVLERLDINDVEMMLKKLAVDFEQLAKLNTFDLLQFGCEAQWLFLWRMRSRGSEEGSSAVHVHMLASAGDVAWCVVLRRRELTVSWWAFSAVVQFLSCLVVILVSSSVSIILRRCWYVVVSHFIRFGFGWSSARCLRCSGTEVQWASLLGDTERSYSGLHCGGYRPF